jgi:lipopolysaccharide transport system ATP-binding protein
MTSSVSQYAEAENFRDNEVVLRVEGVSKKFCRSLKRSLFYGVQDIATELVAMRQPSQSLRNGEFWALKDISLELRRGEALGLVGTNGSGKTTLLRIISGLIRPDTGLVNVRGRVAPLIALGAGFNPLLTGRENIYANMSILGFSTREIRQLFDAVVDFAEIGDAINAPVRSYSSGMAARLGFACAAFTQPDILLLDEVLAVGDARFKAKCERKLAELLRNGTAFVLVSHYAQAILNICNSALYLNKGNLIAFGDARTIMDQYEQDLFSVQIERLPAGLRLPEKPASASMGADITAISFRDAHREIIEYPISGEPAYVCVECRVHQPIAQLSVFIAVFALFREGEIALHLSSAYDQETPAVLPGKYECWIELPSLGLYPGSYNIKAYIKDGSIATLDTVESFRFTVKGDRTLNRGIYYQQRKWQVIQTE